MGYLWLKMGRPDINDDGGRIYPNRIKNCVDATSLPDGDVLVVIESDGEPEPIPRMELKKKLSEDEVESLLGHTVERILESKGLK